MKKSVLAIALCLLLGVSSCASAADFYLIEDSDMRRLTEEELWGWTYEALGFVLNEIFARHGYHFEEGGKYEQYFCAQDWYEEKPDDWTNADVYENEMTDVELYNEELIKNVRREMRRMGTVNPEGKDVPPLEEQGGEVWPEVTEEATAAPGAASTPKPAATSGAAGTPNPASSPGSTAQQTTPKPTPSPTPEPEPWPGPYGYELHFEEMILDADRPLKVYSGPGEKYYRGANGKASVSTNDVIYVAGWQGDWLLVKYWTNAGPSRVGYVHKSGLTCKVDVPQLELEAREVVLVDNCTLTDDPEHRKNEIGTIKEGEKVTFLGSYLRNTYWSYIETKIDGKLVRGFVGADFLSEIEE